MMSSRVVKRLLTVLALVSAIPLSGTGSRVHADPIRVFAAGSLNGAITELIAASGLPASDVAAPVFGPAGLLRRRIEAGELADLFASADMQQAQAIADKGVGLPPVPFARNRLCVLSRQGLGLTSNNVIEQLMDPSVRLATSTPVADPGGDYAWAFFKRAETIHPGAEGVLSSKAQTLLGSPGTMFNSPGHSPGASIFLQNRADALVYYCSGAAAVLDEVPGLSSLPLSSDLDPGPVYGLTVRRGNAAAMQLALFILSGPGQRILQRNGLLPLLSPRSEVSGK